MSRPPHSPLAGAPNLVLMGASTGGTRVLVQLLELLPRLHAAVVIVQHMPKFINTSFVRSLGRNARAEVRLAQDGDALVEGQVLVAPSEVHCMLKGNSLLRLASGPDVNFVCPSVDVAMQSVAPMAPGRQLIGVLLTGMGQDGAAGLAHLKRLGGVTVAQNRASCAIYGMPAQAVKLGVVDYELPPQGIAEFLARKLG